MVGIGGDGVVGVSDGMSNVCDQLKSQATEIQNYIDELEVLKSQLSNDWEGEDFENLLTEFAEFKSKLNELPGVVRSIADWGLSVYENYTDDARRRSDIITSVLRG